MATKERAGEKLLRFPRRDTVNVSRRAFLGLAEAGVGFLLGAVLAGAELFGLYAPFGVAAVAAAGSGVSGFCTLAGTWKVYHDEQNARKTFCKFKKCTDIYCQMLGKGTPLRRLTVAG